MARMTMVASFNIPDRCIDDESRLTSLGTTGSLSRYARICRKVLEQLLLKKNITTFFRIDLYLSLL